MGFRLGEKGKKALRIGSKVGSIAVALAGAGVLGKKTADDAGLTRTGQARQLGDFSKEGMKRGDIGLIPAHPKPVGGGTATAPVQGAQSQKVAIAKVGVGAVGQFLEADSKVGKAKVVVSTAKAIKSAKATSGTQAIQQQQAVAEAKAKAQSTPAVRPKPQKKLTMEDRRYLGQVQQGTEFKQKVAQTKVNKKELKRLQKQVGKKKKKG